MRLSLFDPIYVQQPDGSFKVVRTWRHEGFWRKLGFDMRYDLGCDVYNLLKRSSPSIARAFDRLMTSK